MNNSSHASVIGYSTNYFYDLIVQQDLKIEDFIITTNSNSPEEFVITFNGTELLNLDTSGNLDVLGTLTAGSISFSGNLDMNTNDITNIGNLDINTGGDYLFNSISVLNATTLGSGITLSSLTTLGTQAETLNMGSNQISNITTLTATTLNGTLGTAAQTNITSVGTLSGLTVSAEISTDGVDVSTGNDYQINNVSVLNATTIGTAVVNSSLTSLGTQAEDLVMGSNEITGSVCQSIGALGYVLLDEQEYLALGTDYTTDLMDLDFGSTDDFAFYRIIFRGTFTGSSGNPQMRLRFHDIDGEISISTGHYYRVDAVSNIWNSNSDGYSVFASWTGSTAASLYFHGEFTLTLKGIEETKSGYTGNVSVRTLSGSSMSNLQIAGGLADAADINTRIVGFGIASINATDSDIWMRIYRLL